MNPYSKPRYKNLYGPWEYKKFPWYEDIKQAISRYKYLSLLWDKKEDLRSAINKEMEIIDDYFSWLDTPINNI